MEEPTQKLSPQLQWIADLADLSPVTIVPSNQNEVLPGVIEHDGGSLALADQKHLMRNMGITISDVHYDDEIQSLNQLVRYPDRAEPQRLPFLSIDQVTALLELLGHDKATVEAAIASVTQTSGI